MNRLALTTLSLAMLLRPAAARAADPWADAVVQYAPGGNAPAGYTTPEAALGKPTLFTDPLGMFGGVVTPINSSFGVGETVSLGAGGSLTLRFAEPVTNDALNPFGIDLIVFGNAFFTGDFFTPGEPALVEGIFAEGGSIAVSADGVTFSDVPGEADGLFPTNAYADITQPFTTTPGAVEADFTRPVDPAFNPIGKTFSQIIAGYEGSGGGLGVDIGPTGLSSISYVRITNPDGAAFIPEIDALADVASVPEPAAWQMFFVGALILLGKFSLADNVKAAT
jgi:hypothetical protein